MPRTPAFGKVEFEKMYQLFFSVREMLVEQMKQDLLSRDATKSDLPEDDHLFEPFVDCLAFGTIARPFASAVKDLASNIAEEIAKYESQHKVQINKQHFFFARATLSIQLNDEVNAMIYFERAAMEYNRRLGAAATTVGLISDVKEKFSQVYSSIKTAYDENAFIKINGPKFSFIKSFDDLIASLTDTDLLHFISQAIRNRKMQGLLRQQSDLSMTKVFAQELVNGLVVLNESLLKKNPGVTKKTLGKILEKDIPLVNASVSVHLNDPSTGLFKKYLTNSIGTFNINFPLLLADLGNPMTEDAFKAHLLYGMFMIRNQVLHQFDDAIIYYHNYSDFESAIGLLLACLSATITL